VESGHSATAVPVLSAGVGIRYQGGWALRLASFRIERTDLGVAALGIIATRSPASAALVALLTGRAAPAYGHLRVLGYDLASPGDRAAVRHQIGAATTTARPVSALRIRRLVERAARRSAEPGADRHLLVAAILDRLALMPWAEVPVNAAPELVARKARLAAACVHQPKLLLVDGLLDHLVPRDRSVLADAIRDAQRDSAVIAIGGERDALALVCDQVLAVRHGILVGTTARAPAGSWPDGPAPGGAWPALGPASGHRADVGTGHDRAVPPPSAAP